jgi:cytochrome c oxidase subunit IV
VSYRKPIIVGVGVGLLLAIAVSTIDNIRLARLASGLPSCPAPGCTRLTEIVSAEPLHVLMAFALGFALSFAWFLRRSTMPSNVRRILVATCLPPILTGVGVMVGWTAQFHRVRGAFILPWLALAAGCLVGAIAMQQMQGRRMAVVYAIWLAALLTIGAVILDCVLTTISGGVCDA